MTTFSNPKYSCLLVVQLLLIAGDLLINSLSLLFSNISVTAALILYISQDILLVLSLVMMFLTFFNTLAFASGLMGLLIKKFFWPLAIGVIYISITLGYQIWSMVSRWNEEWVWSGGLVFVYMLHKMTAVFYYYIYKRGLYRLSDSKLYEDSPWMASHMRKRITQ